MIFARRWDRGKHEFGLARLPGPMLPAGLAPGRAVGRRGSKWSISQITVGFPTVGGGPYAGSIVAENHLADHSGSRLVPGPPPLHCPTFPDEFLAEARRLFRARTAASQLRQRAPGLAPSRIPRPLQRGRRGSSRSSSQFHPPVAATLGRRSVHSRRRTRPGPQAGLFPPWTGPSSPRSPVTSSPAPAAP